MTMGFNGMHSLPFYGLGAGIQTEYGTVVPAGTRVLYVRSTGVQSGDDTEIAKRLIPTIAAALLQCRSGQQDIIFVLPGHSENVTDATMFTNLRAGTRIVGVGNPKADNAPTLRWTNTAGQLAVAVKNVTIENMRLRMEGANGVVKALNVTASGFTLIGCDIQVASGASNKATIAIEIGSGANEFAIVGNNFRGTATHNVTDGIKIVGATTPDDGLIAFNTMQFSATAANGLVHCTVAAKNLTIRDNDMINTHTSSTSCITVDAVAADGLVCRNNLGIQAASTIGAAVGFVLGSWAGRSFANYMNDTATTSGALHAALAT